jgi:aerobic-type carbon monoxide dehydrogenase small subunit (CoxS/CutS family)
MRRLLGCAVMATVLATAAVPLVSADSPDWRARTMDCGSAGTITFLLPPAEFVTAFVPVHAATGTRVLTVLEITVNGNTYVSKPLAATAGDRLVTCGYTDPQGLVIRITGLLTPGP